MKAETEALAQRAELVETLRSRDPEMADVLSIATRQLNDIQERLNPGDVLAYALPAEEEAIRFLVIRKDRAWVETAGCRRKSFPNIWRLFERMIHCAWPMSNGPRRWKSWLGWD